jgi:hypothetical protein
MVIMVSRTKRWCSQDCYKQESHDDSHSSS